ncbi:DNA-binding transcriptional MerR regulator [Nocardioides sp. BE266]|uniref:MerR family transcriptional regulator n=1 Tax=Nocardioides sp. BE266 TaxID=2817725 RepID=UPI00285A67D2|nr:MerR family transcriptional regulator [Nocardioides sp. BE266]MDR7252543.1 DNA-binding transcriptional MerR regulator [Nocardioides sp. BE266]
MYTVGRASQLTGVPRQTLRSWEQRYALVAPQRTQGNYRLYDDEAVRRLSVMRELVDAGWAPHEAARRIVDDVAAATARLGDDEVTVAARIDDLAACAEDFDVPRLEHALAEAFAQPDLASVVDDWLLPSMVRLGAAWQRGLVTVAGEHFVTAAVHRRLAHVFQTLPAGPRGGPRVVAGLARGSRHEIGVLAFATVLRSRGIAVTYLGGDLPLDAWVDTVRLLAPAAVVLAAPTADDLPAVREAVQALLPMTPVLLGGAHQAEVAGPRHLGHRAGAAAAALADELTSVLS